MTDRMLSEQPTGCVGMRILLLSAGTVGIGMVLWLL